MNSFDSQRRAAADCFNRRWQDRTTIGPLITPTTSFLPPPPRHFSGSGLFLKAASGLQSATEGGNNDDDFVSTVIPPVTVVLEGRSICQRVSLHKHGSYESLAKALRVMFVEEEEEEDQNDHNFDLSNAVPGHLIAYEDIENDLLLAGDLNWNDFVRVAKRIRILPVKANSRRGKGE